MDKYFVKFTLGDHFIYHPKFYDTLEEAREELSEVFLQPGEKAYIEKAKEDEIFIAGLYLDCPNKEVLEVYGDFSD